MDKDKKASTLDEAELKDKVRLQFLTWFACVADILGWSNDEAVKRFSDRSWFACFTDGLTPEAAVEKARHAGVVG